MAPVQFILNKMLNTEHPLHTGIWASLTDFFIFYELKMLLILILQHHQFKMKELFYLGNTYSVPYFIKIEFKYMTIN